MTEPRRVYAGAYAPEIDALCASPIACAVADAWLADLDDGCGGCVRRLLAESSLELPQAFFDALDAIEAATRESPLRKVRP